MFFFFQAEDGIRDDLVTGVQTCALPICILRFTNFRTSNGPDVHVYLVAADDARDNASVIRAGFIDLGSIKGNIGDQNYALSADVDLSKYRTVSVWCKRFIINFALAPLSPDHTISRN